MDKCRHCWTRYMDAMALSSQAPNPSARRTLILEAHTWLQRYFNAEDLELVRRHRLVRR